MKLYIYIYILDLPPTTVSFEACSVLDHFFSYHVFTTIKPLTSCRRHTTPPPPPNKTQNCGDETGDRYISEALGKADMVLFFGSGQSRRPLTTDDIAQIFRRRGDFEFTSRPKLVHIVNDKTPASSLSATFDCLSQKKNEELKKADRSSLQTERSTRSHNL